MPTRCDYVLSFQEMRDVFEFFHIDPVAMEEDSRDHSSRSGRIYARTGGVSEAMQETVRRLNPDRSISVKSLQADGVPGCRAMLSSLMAGEIGANFIEGMAASAAVSAAPALFFPGRRAGTTSTNTQTEPPIPLPSTIHM